jgi:hypothetical protein
MFGATALLSDFLHPTKCNSYLASSLETFIGEPALHKLLTSHNPNLMSIFRLLGRLST